MEATGAGIRASRGREDGAEKETPLCACGILHEDAVRTAGASLPPIETTTRLSELFKVFGDPSRLRMIAALASAELCVCDLGAVLGMSQSAVSHQLALLRQARLVRYRKQGKVVYYSLDDAHVAELLRVGLAHVGEEGKAS